MKDLDQIAIDKLIQQNNFKIIQSKSVEEFEEIEERKITTIINQPIPKVTSLEKISKLLSRFKDKVASLPSIPDRKVITAEITRDLTRNLVDLKQFIQDVEIVNTSKSEISKIVSQTITESELTTTLDELCELDVISLDVPKVY